MQNHRQFVSRLLRLLPVLLLAAGLAARAGTATWTGTTDGNWGTPANWGGTLPVFDKTLDATFTGAIAGTNFLGTVGRTNQSLNFPAGSTTPVLVRLATAVTGGSAQNLTFDSAGSAAAINIAAGAATHTIGQNSVGSIVLLKNLTITHNGGNSFLIQRPITGSFGVTKEGSGKLTFNAANTFTGGLNVNAGTLSIYSQNANVMGAGIVTFADGVTLNHANTTALTPASPIVLNGSLTVSGGNNLTLAGAVNLGAATRQITADADFAISGAVTNSGGLVKAGAGTLTLGGTCTYTGTTTVSNGVLLVNGSIRSAATAVKSGATFGGNGTVNGSVNVEAGGILSPGGSNTLTGRLAITNNLALTDAVLVLDITNVASADRIAVGGSLLPAGVTVLSLNSPTLLPDGDYTLMEVSGPLGGGPGSFNVASPSLAKLYSIVYQTGATNLVQLHVASVFAGKLWRGGLASNVWDINSTANWMDLAGGAAAVFLDNNRVMFDDFGTTNMTVDIPATVSPALTVVSGSGEYIFTGSGGIGGTNVLIKTGPGSLTLNGVNPFTGSTTVSNGTLTVNGSLGSSTVTVAGGTLAGNGSLGGAVTVTGGGTLNPGSPSGGGNASPGRLQVGGAVNLAGTAIMEVGRGGFNLTNDQVACGGVLTYGGTLTVNPTVKLSGGESFKLFSAAGYAGNFSATNLPPLAAGMEWVWTPDTGTLAVSGSNDASCILKANISEQGGGGHHLALHWPADYRGWVIQSNSMGLADSNAWFDVPGSAGATNLDLVMNSPSQASVFYRLSLKSAVSRVTRPNVLFIIMDDLTTTLGCYGDGDAWTPRMDSLAASGVRFSRAFTQFSLCNPSRSSFLTGYYPERTGIFNLVDSFRVALPQAVTLPQLFKNAGYVTGRIGKVFHVADPATVQDVMIGAPLELDGTILDEVKLAQLTEGDTSDKPRTNSNGVVSYNRPYGAATNDAAAFTDFSIASNAIVTLEAFKDRPFFLAVGFIRPHTPWVAPTAYFDFITPTNLIFLPDYYQPGGENLSGIPYPALRPNNNAFSYAEATLGQAREGRRAYLAAASFADSQVGRVLDKLAELHLDTNTIVVLTGDHGYQLGEHGLWAKQTLFYEGRHVPLIIRAPGMATGVCTGLVEQLDIYPTLAGLAGLPVAADIHGVSLEPNLMNPAAPGKAATFSTMVSTHTDLMGYSVSNERYTYIAWGTNGGGGHQLYDHETDLRELVNLADMPAYAALVAELRTQLTNHVAAVSAP